MSTPDRPAGRADRRHEASRSTAAGGSSVVDFRFTAGLALRTWLERTGTGITDVERIDDHFWEISDLYEREFGRPIAGTPTKAREALRLVYGEVWRALGDRAAGDVAEYVRKTMRARKAREARSPGSGSSEGPHGVGWPLSPTVLGIPDLEEP